MDTCTYTCPHAFAQPHAQHMFMGGEAISRLNWALVLCDKANLSILPLRGNSWRVAAHLNAVGPTWPRTAMANPHLIENRMGGLLHKLLQCRCKLTIYNPRSLWLSVGRAHKHLEEDALQSLQMQAPWRPCLPWIARSWGACTMKRGASCSVRPLCKWEAYAIHMTMYTTLSNPWNLQGPMTTI